MHGFRRFLLLAAALLAHAASAQALASAHAAPLAGQLHACVPARPGHMGCTALFARASGAPFARALPAAQAAASPAAASSPAGFGPAGLHAAYGLPFAAPSSQTIAIVDAFDAPAAASDLYTYETAFGLPHCTTANGCFRRVDQNGGTNFPNNTGGSGADVTGWQVESSLDIEAARAICQSCKIVLVEATDDSTVNLDAAMAQAARLAGVISNSYGAPIEQGPDVPDPYVQQGKVVVAATGDAGYGGSWPAADASVVAVGGTHLSTSATGAWQSETVWNDTYGAPGGGCNSQFPAGSWSLSALSPWPSSCITAGTDARIQSDVSAVADPASGAAIYSTADGGWITTGGTSLAAPIIAATFALAGGAQGVTYPVSLLYSHARLLHDVTSGSAPSTGTDSNFPRGTCPAVLCTAGRGLDGPSGLGTPNGIGAFTVSGAAPAPLAAPTLSAASATALSSASATLTTTINSFGEPSQSSLRWGVAGAPASSVAITDNGSVDAAHQLQVPLSGLAASTTYSAQFQTTDASGSPSGVTFTFTTPAVGASAPVSASGPTSSGSGSSGGPLVGAAAPKHGHGHARIALTLTLRAATLATLGRHGIRLVLVLSRSARVRLSVLVPRAQAARLGVALASRGTAARLISLEQRVLARLGRGRHRLTLTLPRLIAARLRALTGLNVTLRVTLSAAGTTQTLSGHRRFGRR